MSNIDNDLAEILGVSAEPQAESPRLEVVQPDTPAPPLHMQWLKYRDQFAKAMQGSFYSIEELERGIGQGRVLFFPGREAAITAEKATYGGATVLQVTWAVGDADEIVSLAPGIEAMARLLGCSEVLVEGRRGWERSLKPMGYEFFSVTLRKAV